MEHLVTPATATAAPDQTEVAASIPRSSGDADHRYRRVAELREAIERGEYHVTAGDLADALLRYVRRAN